MKTVSERLSRTVLGSEQQIMGTSASDAHGMQEMWMLLKLINNLIDLQQDTNHSTAEEHRKHSE